MVVGAADLSTDPITDIAGVCAATERLAATLPPELSALRDEVVLRAEDHADEVARAREAICSLPPVYARTASSLRLFGVRLGYFQLWPSSTSAPDLGGALVAADRERSSRWVAEAGLIEVGTNEADPLCVEGLGAGAPDRVVLVDHAAPEHVEVVASDFEELLVLAGNLLAVRTAFNGGERGDPVRELEQRVAAITPDEDVRRTWAGLARQAF